MDKSSMVESLVKHYSNGSKAAFAERLGVKPQTIHSWISRSTFDSELIFAKCDLVSPEWLLTGEGDMLREGTGGASFVNSTYTTSPEIKTIGDFKVSEKEIEQQKIPLYELEATAGIFAQGDLTPYVIDYISIPNAPKCDGAILARGDSMEPIIKSGDLLLYKEHDINNIMYGHMYIVDFDLDGDSMIVVKYIKKDKDPKRIVLESENPRYQPMDIALEQVRHIAMVKVSVAFHTMV